MPGMEDPACPFDRKSLSCAAVMKEHTVPLNVLIVDDEINIRKTLSVCLETEGHRVVAVSNSEDALSENARRSFDVAFVDLRLGTASGLDLIPALLAASPWLKIIVITAYASIDTAVEAIKRGATDYIPKPFTPAQVKLVVQRIAEMRSLEQRVATLQADLRRLTPEVDLTTESPAMQRAIELARQVAPTDAIVLADGRKRNREKRSGAGHSRLEQAGEQTLCRDLLPVALGGASGERAFRACQRGLYRRRAGSFRPDRHVRGGNPVS